MPTASWRHVVSIVMERDPMAIFSSCATGRPVALEYCATSTEATDLAGAAQRVMGMDVRLRSASEDALGPHIACAATRALAGADTTVTYLVSVRFDAHPQAAQGVMHVLEAVVSGCHVNR